MAKVRVHELAKKYDVPSKDVLSMLSDLGEFVKAPSSTVEPPVVKRFEDKYGADLATKAGRRMQQECCQDGHPRRRLPLAPALRVAVDAPARAGPGARRAAVARSGRAPLNRDTVLARSRSYPEPYSDTASRPPAEYALRSSLP